MKNIFILIFLLTLSSPCLLAAPGQEETPGAQEAHVIAEKAKIYLEASPFSIVIDTVKRGTVVALFPSGRKDTKWLYISYYSPKRNAQVTGFIKANMVEIFQENPETQQEKTEEKTEEAQDKQDKESSSPVELFDTLKGEREAREKEQSQELKTPEEIKPVAKDMDKAQTTKIEEIEKQKETTEEEAKEQKIEETEDTFQKLMAKEKEQIIEKEQTAVEGAESDAPERKEEFPAEGAKKEETRGNEAKDALQILTKVSIKVRMANVRLMPSLQSAVIHQVPSGVELKALAKAGDWYRVNLPPNEDGFVLSGYVHHSVVNEIYESVQPVVEPEEPEEEPEIIEEEPESVPEPENVTKPSAQTEKSRLSLWIGGGAGYTLPSESHFEKGMSFGGTLGLQVLRYLAVEIRIPYYRGGVAESLGGLSSGQLRNLNFMLSVQARYPLNDRFVPYLVGGGDYHLNKFSLNDAIKNSWNDLGFTIEEKVDHSFGFHAGAGIDFFLLRSIALNVDVRYYSANLKGTWSIADQVSQQEVSGTIREMKLNSIQAGISVKFFLGR